MAKQTVPKKKSVWKEGSKMRMGRARSRHKMHALSGARSFSLFLSGCLGVILCTPLLSGGVWSFRVVTVGVPAIASRQLINKQPLCKGSGLLCKVMLWGFELQLRFLCVHLCSVTQGCLEFGSSEAIVLVSNSYRWLGSPGISVGISCMKPLGR